ncbi:MAG: flagellar basal body-associated FliL family protein [Fibrobacterota bacterium]
MAEEEKNTETEEVQEKSPGKKSNLLLLIGIIAGIILAQVLIGFVTIQFISPDKSSENSPQEESGEDGDAQPEQAAESVENEIILNDAAFETVVNIAGTDGNRFLKVRIILAYDEDDRENKDLISHALKRQSRFKSEAINYLSSLTLKEVLDSNAQENIRSDLLVRFNSILPREAGEFSNVYITEFIVQ